MAEFEGSINENGYQLLEQFELGPNGRPAETAYLCDGDRATLWLGSTVWPNGDPVRLGDICTPEQGVELTNWTLRKFADAVDRLVTAPMTANQRSAFVLLAFNIGIEAFRNSTALSRFNAGQNPLAVAAAFGMWCKATGSGPNKYDLNDAYYLPIISADRKRWIDESGKPCRYQRAFPGLLRRHLSEACLFLDLDWRQACRKDTVSITSTRKWDDNDGRWEDRITKKTELADILPLASQHPLALSAVLAPAATQPAPAKETAPAATPDSANTLNKPAPPPVPGGQAAEKLGAPVAPKPELSASPAAQKSPASVSAIPTAGVGQAAAPGSPALPPPVSKPAPVVLPSQVQKPPPEPVVIAPKQIDMRGVPYGEIPPDAKPKNMTEAARVIGLVIVGIGSIVQVLSAREIISTTIGAIFYDLSRDAAFVAMAAGGLAMVVGWTTRKRGTAVVVKGMVNARALLK
jgi:GH24 family phage-related lysozyme (muramidase)